MLGIVGHHLSVGTGMAAGEAARIAHELGVEAFEISAIPCSVASGFAEETGADYGESADPNKPQVDVSDSEDAWKTTRERVEAEGMQIRALGSYNDFALAEDKLDTEKERVVHSCRMAKALGTDVVRVFGGDLREGMVRGPVLRQIIACFKDVIGAAEEAGVYLAIENHLRLVNDADSLLEIIESVGSPNLKVTLDFTNFYWLNGDTQQTEEAIRRVAPHTVHTHFKNARFEKSECILATAGEGDLDIPMIVDVLLDAVGYDRPFFIACESRDFSDVDDLTSGFRLGVEYMNGVLRDRGVT